MWIFLVIYFLMGCFIYCVEEKIYTGNFTKCILFWPIIWLDSFTDDVLDIRKETIEREIKRPEPSPPPPKKHKYVIKIEA